MEATMAKPPPAYRFGPHNPGRRGGRPRGARNVKTIVRKFAQRKHPVSIGGRKKKVTAVELLLRVTAQLSIDHVDADKLLERLRARCAPDADGREVGVLVVSEDLDIEEWSRRQDILNHFRKPPSTLRDEDDDED